MSDAIELNIMAAAACAFSGALVANGQLSTVCGRQVAIANVPARSRKCSRVACAAAQPSDTNRGFSLQAFNDKKAFKVPH